MYYEFSGTTGYEANGKTFKAHLDGYNQTDLLSGKGPGQRNEIFYFDAGGNLNAIRYKDWKVHFTIMEGAINEAYRKSPSWPLIVNLRMDPYEVGPDAALYVRNFYADQMWMTGSAYDCDRSINSQCYDWYSKNHQREEKHHGPV